MRLQFRFLGLMLALPLVVGASPSWNPQPWLADLAQIRSAVDADYPNLEWLTNEREASLDKWFDRAATTIRASTNDEDAKRALDGLIRRFNDGHLRLDWAKAPTNEPSAAVATPIPTSVAQFCAARGFDAQQVSIGTAAAMPGYVAVPSNVFASGTIRAVPQKYESKGFPNHA